MNKKLKSDYLCGFKMTVADIFVYSYLLPFSLLFNQAEDEWMESLINIKRWFAKVKQAKVVKEQS